MKASVIIPVWNGQEYLPDCLDALLVQDYRDFEIIAVDNASADGSADLVAENYPAVRLIRNERNLGFAGGCNVGLRAADGDVLVLLNQDVIVQPNWLLALVDGVDEPGVGIAGAKLLEPDGRTLSHAGGYLEWPVAMGLHIGAGEVDRGQYDVARDVEYVTGASLAVRSDTLDAIGSLDARFYPGFYEDVDFCWRARDAGWRVKYEPRATGIHDEASSTRHHWLSRHYYHYRSRLLFVFKHVSPSEILGEFVPAEKERIRSLPPDELRAGHVALTEVLSMWPVMSRDLPTTERGDACQERLLQGLRTLRGQIVRQQGGDPALRMPEPHGNEGKMRRPSRPGDDALADELMGLWEVQEQPFTSQVPVAGRWISAFRELWNSVATKWYVRPMLAQQVQFNGAVVRALNRLEAIQRLEAHFWDDDALLALLAERCGRMTARVVELEERLAQARSIWEDGGETRHE
ncbi:MAG: glycosyltransferase family 2 protein [bacterium]